VQVFLSRHLNEQLIDAACKGKTVTIKKLIAAGADPNYRNAQINTPLMWAVTHRHLDAAQVLLESGADVNGQDVMGGTALIVAASNGDLPMLEMLLRVGADAHVTDYDGNTALVWATHNNHVAAASLLQDWESTHGAC
jgi:ankyrin repeat protein